MRPISWGTRTVLRFCDARSMPAHTNAANAMPTGLLRPSRATAMPVKPMAVGKVSPYLCRSASSGPMPARPATAPDSSIVFMIMAFGLTPDDRAAFGFMPVVRRSNPKRVR